MHEADRSSSNDSLENSSSALKITESVPRNPPPWSSYNLAAAGTPNSHLRGQGLSWTAHTRTETDYNIMLPPPGTIESKNFERCASSPGLCFAGASDIQRNCAAKESFCPKVNLGASDLETVQKLDLKKQLTSGLRPETESTVACRKRGLKLQKESQSSGRDEFFNARSECLELLPPHPALSRIRDSEQRPWVYVNLQDEPVLLSLRPDTKPTKQTDRKRHLQRSEAEFDLQFQPLRTDSPPLVDASTSFNLRTHDDFTCGQSMSGSVIQQCSDLNDFENTSQFPFLWDSSRDPGSRLLDRNPVPHNTDLAFDVNNELQLMRRGHEDLLQEIKELKEANCRQSLFIEKIMNEKRLLETAVSEQAQVIFYQQNGSRVSSRPPNSSGNLDLQLYETQLAMYKEDFENERKDKVLALASAESLKEQLRTVLKELQLSKDKLLKAEEELERYKNPFRTSASSEPLCAGLAGQRNNTGQYSTASGQTKTRLYRKPDQLEPDRPTLTSVCTQGQSSPIYQGEVNRPERHDLVELSRHCHDKSCFFAAAAAAADDDDDDDVVLTSSNQSSWVNQQMECYKRILAF